MSDLKLHEPVTSTRVVPRWQRKEQERSRPKQVSKTSSNNASFSSQSNVSASFGDSFSAHSEARKTPGKPSLVLNMPYKTTNSDGTPKKKISACLRHQNKVGTPVKMSKSREGKPRSAHTTPSCDRFIPSRSGNNFENSGFDLLNNDDSSKDSPTTRRFKDGMKQNLSIGKPKILNMRNKAPTPATNLLNPQSKVRRLEFLENHVFLYKVGLPH